VHTHTHAPREDGVDVGEAEGLEVDLHADDEAAAAHLLNVRLLQLLEPRTQQLAHAADVGQERRLRQAIKHHLTRTARQRLPRKGAAVVPRVQYCVASCARSALEHAPPPPTPRKHRDTHLGRRAPWRRWRRWGCRCRGPWRASSRPGSRRSTRVPTACPCARARTRPPPPGSAVRCRHPPCSALIPRVTACLHFVKHQERLVVVAEAAELAQERVRDDVDTALALDRLYHHATHIVAQHRPHAIQVPHRHVVHPRQQRRERLLWPPSPRATHAAHHAQPTTRAPRYPTHPPGTWDWPSDSVRPCCGRESFRGKTRAGVCRPTGPGRGPTCAPA
jgi:hypothetical protein